MLFQFSGPNGTSSATASGASTPSGSDGQGANGVGRWIERVNNLQDRADVPQSKRRKLEDEEAFQTGTALPMRGGTGILADYVKEMRKEGIALAPAAAATVDLTDGK